MPISLYIVLLGAGRVQFGNLAGVLGLHDVRGGTFYPVQYSPLNSVLNTIHNKIRDCGMASNNGSAKA